jgi:hypothetical protein
MYNKTDYIITLLKNRKPVTHIGLPKDCKYGRCTFIQPNWFNAPSNTNNPAEVVKHCMLRDHLVS